MKREIRVEDAVGMVLAHDLTRIVPGEFKGRLFAKGHRISEEDLPKLLAIGKEHIYVLEPEAHELHEDDAAERMARALCHESLRFTEPNEGKVNAKAAHDGLLVIDVERLDAINGIGDVVVVTKPTHQPVREGQTVAGLRAIPLLVDAKKIAAYEAIAAEEPLLRVLPFLRLSVGVVTTGSEVFKGRITDKFGPRIQEKLKPYGLLFAGQRIVDDQLDDIVAAIRAFQAEKADVILVTGGMSVDPDDRSPLALRTVAAEVVTYGMPVLPGSMTMLAYAGETVLMGLPGCVIYDEVTAFDWLLPRVAAGLRPTRAEIARFGCGGLL
ncbi:molybdopterin-binding protein [Ferroacidibacillus organovorans]|nr:molybdopterin-binding protein [Ferroacidibacillus organovorans]